MRAISSPTLAMKFPVPLPIPAAVRPRGCSPSSIFLGKLPLEGHGLVPRPLADQKPAVPLNHAATTRFIIPHYWWHATQLATGSTHPVKVKAKAAIPDRKPVPVRARRTHGCPPGHTCGQSPPRRSFGGPSRSCGNECLSSPDCASAACHPAALELRPRPAGRGHHQVYRRGFEFQLQNVRTFPGGFKVLAGGGPASTGVKTISLRVYCQTHSRRLRLFESAFIPNPTRVDGPDKVRRKAGNTLLPDDLLPATAP